MKTPRERQRIATAFAHRSCGHQRSASARNNHDRDADRMTALAAAAGNSQCVETRSMIFPKRSVGRPSRLSHKIAHHDRDHEDRPMTIPGFARGMMMFARVCHPVAPHHRRLDQPLSMRIIELKINCQRRRRGRPAQATENSEALATPAALDQPALEALVHQPVQAEADHAILGSFEVQNGMVQSKVSTICGVLDRTWNARK